MEIYRLEIDDNMIQKISLDVGQKFRKFLY